MIGGARPALTTQLPTKGTKQLRGQPPTCVLPGCSAPVDVWGEPCAECLNAAAGYLIRVDGPAMTQQQIQDRDAGAVAAYQLQRELAVVAAEPESKRNQTCWLCEERRTCMRTPHGWECRRCQHVT